jgi:hypothetical protein
MNTTKIVYNQFNPQEVCYGNVLNDFIKAEFNDEYQDIIVHFDNDPMILVEDTTQLYVKLLDYSTGNWNPDAITSIEVRRPEFSKSIEVEAKHL